MSLAEDEYYAAVHMQRLEVAVSGKNIAGSGEFGQVPRSQGAMVIPASPRFDNPQSQSFSLPAAMAARCRVTIA